VSTHLTVAPSAEQPGAAAVGKPIHFPYLMFCTMGERFCGRVWTAKDEADLLLKTATRREHEATCNGGLILATGIGGIR
jgi:hypothetical protein